MVSTEKPLCVNKNQIEMIFISKSHDAYGTALVNHGEVFIMLFIKCMHVTSRVYSGIWLPEDMFLVAQILHFSFCHSIHYVCDCSIRVTAVL